MSDCTEASFLKDVANHEMIVLRDDGVNRHIRFKRPETSCYLFDLITWPGYLCYTGDMGTYVFSRLEDMFAFFRMDSRDWNFNKDGGLSINPGYWGEKLEAVDRCDGFMKWSVDKFTKRARIDFTEYLSDNNPENADEIKERFEDEVMFLLDGSSKEEAYRAMMNFEVDGDYIFQDWWEVDTDEYAYRFLWCCYAVAWAIAEYDASKVPTTAEAA